MLPAKLVSRGADARREAMNATSTNEFPKAPRENAPEQAPVVSVCIPMYNNADTIRRSLQSVLMQDGVDFEILVLDDDSTDGGPDVVRDLLRPQDRLIRNGSRLGLVGNHNKCVTLARGTYVQFVHADDWLLPGALRTLAAALDEADGGMAFAPREVVTDDAGFVRQYGQLHKHFRGLEKANDGRKLAMQLALRGAHHNWIGEPTCVMFRRDLALEAGLFRSDIYQLLDLDLWLRLMVRSTVCFHQVAVSVRNHTSSTTSVQNKAQRRDWLDQLRVLSSMVVDPGAPTAIRIVNLVWWVPIWIRSAAEALVFGPQRAIRLREAAVAPLAELVRARRVFKPHR